MCFKLQAEGQRGVWLKISVIAEQEDSCAVMCGVIGWDMRGQSSNPHLALKLVGWPWVAFHFPA